MPHSVVRSIGFEESRTRRVEVSKDRSRGESLFELLEGVLSFEVPLEGNTFLGEGSKRTDQLRIVEDETPIEVREAEK